MINALCSGKVMPTAEKKMLNGQKWLIRCHESGFDNCIVCVT